ncbi:hypothetical protein [Minwuia thermotolerans]|uniref:Alpha/beta hydrolase n=1 Tax=Minwuia thermotolerans TaxID=2056226 RepID=A0A2M9G3X3_9PROT|nr:hypothetical protein [Minwuia thermotolerans]PJK30398.1 hypothetical protein CVT23_07000 [Minwuia thermotolerans]
MHSIRLTLRALAALALLTVAHACAAEQSAAQQDVSQTLVSRARPALADGYPPTLSLGVKRKLARYREEPWPLAFVVAPDGGYATYWRCSGPGCDGTDREYVAQVQEVCRRFGHKGDCLVHSIRDRKIWPGPEVFETGVRSRLIVPWKHDNIGPERARGVIVHIPGFGGDRYPPSLDHERAPFFLRQTNKEGWDTYRLNIAHYDYGIDNEAEINARIAETVREMRRRGYARVYLNGQSRGAWQILGAAQASDLAIDGAFIMVPAAHGRAETWDGRTNPRYADSDADFRELIAPLGRYRLFFGFFRGDQYDPGGRAEAIGELHGDRVGESIFVLDRPPDLAGHGATWHRAFDGLYARCVRDFLEGIPVAFESCTDPLSLENDGMVATREHVIARGGERMEDAELRRFFDGRAAFPAAGPRGWWGLLAEPGGGLLQWFPGSYLTGNTIRSEWRVEDDGFCIIGSPRLNANRYCYDVYRLDDGRVAMVAPDGLAFVGATQPADDVAALGFTPGDWRGEEGS